MRANSLITVQINARALLDNYAYLQNRNPKLTLMPVLKSNAYGHGLKEVYTILLNQKPELVCVHSLEEALEIHDINPEQRVLILGYVDARQISPKLPFDFCVWSREQILEISKYHSEPQFHIFVDTGMHREGLRVDELEQLLQSLDAKLKSQIVGINSHFAAADDPDSLQSEEQLSAFRHAIEILNSYDINPRIRHISASAGTVRKLGTDLVTHCRSGLALFGIHPLGIHTPELQPVLDLQANVIQIKQIHAGEHVGYNATFKATSEMKIALIPAGYNDGIDRRLSNLGQIKFKNSWGKILGRVSMNITIFDASAMETLAVGDYVTVYSSNNNDANSIANIARACATIPYDILVSINPELARVVV